MNAREFLLGGVAAGALGIACIAAPDANAQSNYGTTVTQSGARADAATALTGPAGGRTTCSTSQDTVANLTVTLTPNAGNFVYVTGVYITGLANATGATSTTIWSSTNLVGAPAWLTPTTASAAANPTGVIQISESYGTGLKAQNAGTAVTLVPQATTASAFLCPRVAWYQAPQ